MPRQHKILGYKKLHFVENESYNNQAFRVNLRSVYIVNSIYQESSVPQLI